MDDVALSDEELNGEESYESRWEGYAQYEWVSKEIAATINDAIDAYALVDSAHAENAPLNPAVAAKARSKLLSASIQLLNEMDNDRDEVEDYEEILDRWEGDDGYIQKLSNINLQQNCPGWLLQLAMDLRKAGWELGYLKAGRMQRKNPPDKDHEEVRSMFE